MNREINIYATIDAWLKEDPDAVINGEVKGRGDGWVEIADENGFTQIINIHELFAIVY